MRRRSFYLKTMDEEEANQINSEIDILFSNKVESVSHTNSASEAQTFLYREEETGRRAITGTESAIMSSNIVFQAQYTEIFNVSFTPIGVSFSVNLVSVTATGAQIQIEATASLGTQTYNFFWRVMGRLP